MKRFQDVLLGAAIMAGTVSCRDHASNSPISAITIEVTGHNFEWIVRYPGPDGALGTPDDVLDRQDVHVPVGADTTIILKSRDFVYAFALPQFERREIAVPDLEFTMRFTPHSAGTFELLGDEMCGYPHATLVGKLRVEPAPEFRAWLNRRR